MRVVLTAPCGTGRWRSSFTDRHRMSLTACGLRQQYDGCDGCDGCDGYSSEGMGIEGGRRPAAGGMAADRWLRRRGDRGGITKVWHHRARPAEAAVRRPGGDDVGRGGSEGRGRTADELTCGRSPAGIPPPLDQHVARTAHRSVVCVACARSMARSLWRSQWWEASTQWRRVNVRAWRVIADGAFAWTRCVRCARLVASRAPCLCQCFSRAICA